MNTPGARRARPPFDLRITAAGGIVRGAPLYGKRPAVKRILCAVCCFAAAALAQQNTGPSLESGVEAEVLRVRVAKDDLGAFRAVGDKALSALRLCPQSARLWYLAARSAEVLESPSNGQAFAAEGGLKRIVAD